MKTNCIITGATGMVGEGVLHECLLHPDVVSVMVIGRKPCGMKHPKLSELILPDLSDLQAVESSLSGFDACFFCAGVSSVGMKMPEYTRLTYDLTMGFARTLVRYNPDMVFCYVSGAGTDSSEKGRFTWARIKGKTENDLMKLPFRAAYAFRPAFIRPTPGLKNTLSFYKYISWLYPVLRNIAPGYFGTLKELGLAMIKITETGYEKRVLEAVDIADLAGR